MLAGKKTVRYENYEVPIRERERRAWYHGIDLDRVGEFDCVAVVGEDRYSGDGLSKVFIAHTKYRFTKHTLYP